MMKKYKMTISHDNRTWSELIVTDDIKKELEDDFIRGRMAERLSLSGCSSTVLFFTKKVTWIRFDPIEPEQEEMETK